MGGGGGGGVEYSYLLVLSDELVFFKENLFKRKFS